MGRQKQKLKLCSHKPRNAWGNQTVNKAREDDALEPLEEAQSCQHLNFRLLASEL